jgi:hypothetical protein
MKEKEKILINVHTLIKNIRLKTCAINAITKMEKLNLHILVDTQINLIIQVECAKNAILLSTT